MVQGIIYCLVFPYLQNFDANWPERLTKILEHQKTQVQQEMMDNFRKNLPNLMLDIYFKSGIKCHLHVRILVSYFLDIQS